MLYYVVVKFPYNRVCEVWFDDPNEWHKAVVENADKIPTPAWADKASQDAFPYVKPLQEIVGIFLTDRAAADNLNPYNGYVAMR